MKPGKTKRIYFLATEESGNDQECGNILCDDTGKGNTHHIQAADDDEKQVQYNVDDPGYSQIAKGFSGIAHGTVYSIPEVIQGKCGHSEKIDSQIQQSTIHQFRLGVQKLQNTMCEQDAGQKQQLR